MLYMRIHVACWSQQHVLLEIHGCGIYLSVQFSCSVVSDSLRPHESQHARPPCPSPAPGVHSDLHPLSRWCPPASSSSVVLFSPAPIYLSDVLIAVQYSIGMKQASTLFVHPSSCLWLFEVVYRFYIFILFALLNVTVTNVLLLGWAMWNRSFYRFPFISYDSTQFLSVGAYLQDDVWEVYLQKCWGTCIFSFENEA